MILDAIAYSTEKNLGKEYNRIMSLVGDDHHVCLRDGDTCWLTPDYGMHLAEYVRLYPTSILTCWTNRIHELAEQQHPSKYLRESSNFREHLIEALNKQATCLYHVTSLHGFVSGFCMIIPKSVWNNHKFAEQQVYEDRGPHNLLGCDNEFTNRVRAAGIPVLRMDGIYLFHVYRMLKGDHDKSHLL